MASLKKKLHTERGGKKFMAGLNIPFALGGTKKIFFFLLGQLDNDWTGENR